MTTRRAFMKGGAMALVGTSSVPSFLQRTDPRPGHRRPRQKVSGDLPARRRRRPQHRRPPRGTQLLPPAPHHRHPQSPTHRPRWILRTPPRPEILQAPLRSGPLAIVQAAGSPDTTRSHFDAQDFMESGTPGVKATPDGWLNRALQAEDLEHARKPLRLPRRRPGHAGPPHARRKDRRRRRQPPAGLHRRRQKPKRRTARRSLRGHVRQFRRHRAYTPPGRRPLRPSGC